MCMATGMAILRSGKTVPVQFERPKRVCSAPFHKFVF